MTSIDLNRQISKNLLRRRKENIFGKNINRLIDLNEYTKQYIQLDFLFLLNLYHKGLVYTAIANLPLHLTFQYWSQTLRKLIA